MPEKSSAIHLEGVERRTEVRQINATQVSSLRQQQM
jgi:hypothetical protein